MRRALAAALCCLASAAPVAAEDKATAIAAVLDKAIEEHRVLLNCSATDAATHALVVKNWQADVLAAVPLLAEAGYDGEAIAGFATRAGVGAMMMRDRPFADVIALCNDNPDALRRMFELNYVVLPLALRRVLDGGS